MRLPIPILFVLFTLLTASEEVQLVSLQEDIIDQGLLSRVTMTGVFDNPTDLWQEGVIDFRLPPGTVIDGFGLWVAGRYREAVFIERGRASRIYDEITNAPWRRPTDRGEDPALLMRMPDGRYRITVYPIMDRDSAQFRVRYLVVLPQNRDIRPRLLSAEEPVRTLDRRGSLALLPHQTVTLHSADTSSPALRLEPPARHDEPPDLALLLNDHSWSMRFRDSPPTPPEDLPSERCWRIDYNHAITTPRPWLSDQDPPTAHGAADVDAALAAALDLIDQHDPQRVHLFLHGDLDGSWGDPDVRSAWTSFREQIGDRELTISISGCTPMRQRAIRHLVRGHRDGHTAWPVTSDGWTLVIDDESAADRTSSTDSVVVAATPLHALAAATEATALVDSATWMRPVSADQARLHQQAAAIAQTEGIITRASGALVFQDPWQQAQYGVAEQGRDGHGWLSDRPGSRRTSVDRSLFQVGFSGNAMSIGPPPRPTLGFGGSLDAYTVMQVWQASPRGYWNDWRGFGSFTEEYAPHADRRYNPIAYRTGLASDYRPADWDKIIGYAEPQVHLSQPPNALVNLWNQWTPRGYLPPESGLPGLTIERQGSTMRTIADDDWGRSWLVAHRLITDCPFLAVRYDLPIARGQVRDGLAALAQPSLFPLATLWDAFPAPTAVIGSDTLTLNLGAHAFTLDIETGQVLTYAYAGESQTVPCRIAGNAEANLAPTIPDRPVIAPCTRAWAVINTQPMDHAAAYCASLAQNAPNQDTLQACTARLLTHIPADHPGLAYLSPPAGDYSAIGTQDPKQKLRLNYASRWRLAYFEEQSHRMLAKWFDEDERTAFWNRIADEAPWLPQPGDDEARLEHDMSRDRHAPRSFADLLVALHCGYSGSLDLTGWAIDHCSRGLELDHGTWQLATELIEDELFPRRSRRMLSFVLCWHLIGHPLAAHLPAPPELEHWESDPAPLDLLLAFKQALHEHDESALHTSGTQIVERLRLELDQENDEDQFLTVHVKTLTTQLREYGTAIAPELSAAIVAYATDRRWHRVGHVRDGYSINPLEPRVLAEAIADELTRTQAEALNSDATLRGEAYREVWSLYLANPHRYADDLVRLSRDPLFREVAPTDWQQKLRSIHPLFAIRERLMFALAQENFAQCDRLFAAYDGSLPAWTRGAQWIRQAIDLPPDQARQWFMAILDQIQDDEEATRDLVHAAAALHLYDVSSELADKARSSHGNLQLNRWRFPWLIPRDHWHENDFELPGAPLRRDQADGDKLEHALERARVAGDTSTELSLLNANWHEVPRQSTGFERIRILDPNPEAVTPPWRWAMERYRQRLDFMIPAPILERLGKQLGWQVEWTKLDTIADATQLDAHSQRLLDLFVRRAFPAADRCRMLIRDLDLMECSLLLAGTDPYSWPPTFKDALWRHMHRNPELPWEHFRRSCDIKWSAFFGQRLEKAIETDLDVLESKDPLALQRPPTPDFYTSSAWHTPKPLRSSRLEHALAVITAKYEAIQAQLNAPSPVDNLIRMSSPLDQRPPDWLIGRALQDPVDLYLGGMEKLLLHYAACNQITVNDIDQVIEPTEGLRDLNPIARFIDVQSADDWRSFYRQSQSIGIECHFPVWYEMLGRPQEREWLPLAADHYERFPQSVRRMSRLYPPDPAAVRKGCLERLQPEPETWSPKGDALAQEVDPVEHAWWGLEDIILHKEGNDMTAWWHRYDALGEHPEIVYSLLHEQRDWYGQEPDGLITSQSTGSWDGWVLTHWDNACHLSDTPAYFAVLRSLYVGAKEAEYNLHFDAHAQAGARENLTRLQGVVLGKFQVALSRLIGADFSDMNPLSDLGGWSHNEEAPSRSRNIRDIMRSLRDVVTYPEGADVLFHRIFLLLDHHPEMHPFAWEVIGEMDLHTSSSDRHDRLLRSHIPSFCEFAARDAFISLCKTWLPEDDPLISLLDDQWAWHQNE